MTNFQPKVSIIVPVYNNEKYVKRCLDSILNQTYRNLEILIINDGSTDNTQEICVQMNKKDNRIYLINSENFGVSHARNLGIEKVTGDYVTFIDSDDYIEKNHIQKLIENITLDDIDMLIFGYTRIKNSDNKYEIIPSKPRII